MEHISCQMHTKLILCAFTCWIIDFQNLHFRQRWSGLCSAYPQSVTFIVIRLYQCIYYFFAFQMFQFVIAVQHIWKLSAVSFCNRLSYVD